MRQKQFEDFVRNVEPAGRRCALAWRTAIGLMATDGLKTSKYLLELAKRNIEGEISMPEVPMMIERYYRGKTRRAKDFFMKKEADREAANIKSVLSDNSFSFNLEGLISIHRRIFEGVSDYAGALRDNNLEKKEWLLNGDSMRFFEGKNVCEAVESDLRNESVFDYDGLSDVRKVRHISVFASNLWLIHPFNIGNTCTIAVFMIQYLRSMGYEVNNDVFAEKSWYFRNALVRANYKNQDIGVDYDFRFLERFFKNLIFNGNNRLRINHLVVWKNKK